MASYRELQDRHYADQQNFRNRRRSSFLPCVVSWPVKLYQLPLQLWDALCPED